MNRFNLYFILALSVAGMTGCASLLSLSTAVDTRLVTHVVSTETEQPWPIPVTWDTEMDLLPDVEIKEHQIALNYTPSDVACLAQNMYWEARGEGRRGMTAVGYVTLNRKHSPNHWPNTICGVVREGPVDSRGRPVLNRCQFSWYCDGRSDVITNPDLYRLAEDIAHAILREEANNPVGNSTFFHNARTRPNWRRYAYVGRVGNHHFYALKTDRRAAANLVAQNI